MAKAKFLDEINQNYNAKAGNIFLLHGNVNDIFEGRDGEWKSLLPLLFEDFSKRNRIYVQVDLSGGFKILPVWPNDPDDLPPEERMSLTGHSPASSEKKLEAMREEHQKKQTELLRSRINTRENSWDVLERESIQSSFSGLLLARTVFEALLRIPGGESYRVIYILNDLSSMAPEQSEGNLSESDRRNIQLLHKWFNTGSFLNSRHVVLMVSETLENVNAKIRSLPQVTPVKIWRPNAESRKTFISRFLAESKPELALARGVNADLVAEATAGLTIRDVEQLLRRIRHDGTPENPAELTLQAIDTRAKDVLEKSLGNQAEFVDLDHGLDAVIGQDRLKPFLLRDAAIFRRGAKAAIPNGILVPGPNGGGKTFVVDGFIKETGWVAIILKGFRNMYYGETERIFERFEEIVEARSRLIIKVDEGDTELGGRGENVHEVDKRLFGKILRMMEDKRNKGRICWIIITARPDKLEPDLKRSGRAGRHYPVFAPETKEERAALVEVALLKRVGLTFRDFKFSAGPEPTGTGDEPPKLAEGDELLHLIENYYPADFGHLVEQLECLKESGAERITAKEVLEEARHARPAESPLQRRLQILVAIAECTDDRLVPALYEEFVKDREKLAKEIRRCKDLLGER